MPRTDDGGAGASLMLEGGLHTSRPADEVIDNSKEETFAAGERSHEDC
jgi:hypothetical protein